MLQCVSRVTLLVADCRTANMYKKGASENFVFENVLERLSVQNTFISAISLKRNKKLYLGSIIKGVSITDIWWEVRRILIPANFQKSPSDKISWLKNFYL